ncbi:MAG: hypothetical protein M0R17_03180 [Candidatus Omnitrophica bacterium]|jgi:hypothetical protein|nr:hypothetical protein [Candidatus Omnitrophota bacterium]
MEQDCSNKIVSFHLHRCQNECTNKNICYLLNRKPSANYNCISQEKISNLIYTFKVYESICYRNEIRGIQALKNYNITISSEIIKDFPESLIKDCTNKIQISVYDYNIHKICSEYPDHQKLFLIKDNYTLKFAEGLMNILTGKLCFIIELKYLEQIGKAGLYTFLKLFYNRFDLSQNLDTCLSSWLLNGHCPYEHNYIDINYDGTVRKCPYEKEGHEIPSFNTTDIVNFMDSNLTPKCIYSQWLGDTDVRHSTSVQDTKSDRGIRTDFKHSRRLSLRS